LEWRNLLNLKSAIYLLVSPVFMMFAALACGTVVNEMAYYACPTAAATITGTQIPGIPTPMPSITTPYILQAPAAFYKDDAVFVGQPGAALRLRFRLMDVETQPASPPGGQPRILQSWSLEIKNLGSIPYETVPPALMVILSIDTTNGIVEGTWPTSEMAMQAVGIVDQSYDPVQPGETRVFGLAAYTLPGTVDQLAYLLDGAGNNQITWRNAVNPYCSGDVAD